MPANLDPQVISISELIDKNRISLFDKGILNLPAKRIGMYLVSQKGFTSNIVGWSPKDFATAIDWFAFL